MGVILYGPRPLKYPEGHPKSLHEYVMKKIQSYLNPTKKD